MFRQTFLCSLERIVHSLFKISLDDTQVLMLHNNCYSYTYLIIIYILLTISISPIDIRKDNSHLKRKHSALQTSHRGVKISGVEEARPINFSSKYENLRSADVKKLRESLKSSSLELKALVKDPLPDALHTSEAVRSKLATKDINRGTASEKQSEQVDVRDSDACKTIVLYQPNDANVAKKPSVSCSSDHRPNCSNGRRPNYSNDRRPNLMRRATSGQTYVVIIYVIICFNMGVDYLLYSYVLTKGVKDAIM